MRVMPDNLCQVQFLDEKLQQIKFILNHKCIYLLTPWLLTYKTKLSCQRAKLFKNGFH